MVKIDWLTETDIKENMKNGIKNAKSAHEYGINNPRRNPIEAAVEAIKSGIWEKNFKAAVDDWVKELGKLTLEDWKKVSISAAVMYADKASSIGAENWGKYYEKAKSVIETAAAELVKSPQGKEDFIKFYEAMGKLSDIKY